MEGEPLIKDGRLTKDATTLNDGERLEWGRFLQESGAFTHAEVVIKKITDEAVRDNALRLLKQAKDG